MFLVVPSLGLSTGEVNTQTREAEAGGRAEAWGERLCYHETADSWEAGCPTWALVIRNAEFDPHHPHSLLPDRESSKVHLYHTLPLSLCICD